MSTETLQRPVTISALGKTHKVIWQSLQTLPCLLYDANGKREQHRAAMVEHKLDRKMECDVCVTLYSFAKISDLLCFRTEPNSC